MNATANISLQNRMRFIMCEYFFIYFHFIMIISLCLILNRKGGGVFLLSEVISTYIEHKKERGKGGHEKKNLRVLCFCRTLWRKRGVVGLVWGEI